MATIPIDECPAGPAIDAAVAEALGHLAVWRGDIGKWYIASDGDAAKRGFKYGLFMESTGKKVISYCLDMPKYSMDIAEAWKLVTHLRLEDFGARLYDDATSLMFHVSFFKPDVYNRTELRAISEIGQEALAICRAFLKANGIESVETESNG